MNTRPILSKSHNTPSRIKRRGGVLVAAMVALAIISAMTLAMVRSSLMHSRQARQEQYRAQAECLLEAGRDRAAHQLRTNSNYFGETWDLASDQIVDRHAGQVTIRVTAPTERNSERFLVEVTAEYPAGSPVSVRRSRTFRLSN